MAGIVWKKRNIMQRTVLLPGCHYQNHIRRTNKC
uniref:Geminivirus AL2 protein n=1 Tax=Myoviridae sp. ctp7F23 TaxID=2825174 RepID=A0A8S5U8V1_9CAUD|nr:MAG TPA: Geminivirus AL2 protein [Myoviridae sp. ctp7F23]